MAFDLSKGQRDSAASIYYSSESRVPRQRIGLGLSVICTLVCAVSGWEALTGAVIILWGIVSIGVMLWDGGRAYNRARHTQPQAG